MYKYLVMAVLVILSGCQTTTNSNTTNVKPNKPEPSLVKTAPKPPKLLWEFIPENSPVYFITQSKVIHETMNIIGVQMFWDLVEDRVKTKDGFEQESMEVFDIFEGIFQSLLSEKGAQEFGFHTQGQTALFLQGIVPVLKVSVADKVKLKSKLNEVFDVYPQFNHSIKVINGELLSVLKLGDLKLIYQISDEIFTVAFVNAALNDSTIKEVFNKTPLSNSIKQSKDFMGDQLKYAFNDQSKFVLNIQEIASALVDPQSNLLGRHLMLLHPQMQNKLTLIHSPSCKSELMGIAQLVPRLVAGTEQIQLKNGYIKSKKSMILEILNPEANSILNQLVGESVSHEAPKDALLNVDVGLNVASISSSYTQLKDLLKSKKYNCFPLAAIQSALPDSLGEEFDSSIMAFSSITGASFSLVDFELEFDTAQPGFEFVDSILSVSSNQPNVLVSMLEAIPTMGDIAQDSTPVKWESNYIPPGLDFYSVVKNNWLAFYVGDKSSMIVNSVKENVADSNTFLKVAINLGSWWAKEDYFRESLIYTGNNICQNSEDQQIFNWLASNRGSLEMQLEFNEHGIELISESEMIKSNTSFDICP